jgi:hypothetical protein
MRGRIDDGVRKRGDGSGAMRNELVFVHRHGEREHQ